MTEVVFHCLPHRQWVKNWPWVATQRIDQIQIHDPLIARQESSHCPPPPSTTSAQFNHLFAILYDKPTIHERDANRLKFRAETAAQLSVYRFFDTQMLISCTHSQMERGRETSRQQLAVKCIRRTSLFIFSGKYVRRLFDTFNVCSAIKRYQT